MRNRVQRHAKGFSAIYLVITLIVFCGLCSFGVDLGRVHVVKSELQDAVDAAARAAALALGITLVHFGQLL